MNDINSCDLPLFPSRGGFRTGKVDRPRVGCFIRDFLAGSEAIAFEIYTAYKARVNNTYDYEYIRKIRRRIKKAMENEVRKELNLKPRQHIPKRSDEQWEVAIEAELPNWMATHRLRKPQRKCCSYHSFSHYIYAAKVMGLIVETGMEVPARGVGGSGIGTWHMEHTGKYLRLIDGGSPAWDNLMGYYRVFAAGS